MRHIQSSIATRTDWLSDGPLAPHGDAYKKYLTGRGYAASTIGSCMRSVAHFAQWLEGADRIASCIDDSVVTEFLDIHLPKCRCTGPICRHRKSLSAALGHLLVVLRTRGVVAAPKVKTTPADVELLRFDKYMDHVRGLAPKTRRAALRIVGRLLAAQFGDGPVDVTAINPEGVRAFFAQQSEFYSKPANAGVVIAALRGYFRYRISRGNAMHTLIGVLSYPANWQLSSLPKTLTPEDVEQLLGSLGQTGRSMRRSDAIVRCALDLGLRSGEVARLSLDDINWHAGTITLRHTKGCREDVLPLPATTGKAIVAYLKEERPTTSLRALFLRHNAPLDRPAGPDLVRKTIRQAFARAGLPYTRSHLLRHTMANRLLAGGSSLKEVADVLRHRSLNTTMIYAKLDSRKLTEVALPWPGSLS